MTSDSRMFFKGNSSRLQQLIEKIQANKENHNVTQQVLREALGTEAGSSWSSEGHSSPPSSCATPNSASDLPDSELTFTVGVTEGTPYGCQFCNKAFPRLSYLKKHEQTHSEHLPFVCEFCKRRFKHKRSKDRHLKLHTGDKRYKCAQCEAAFARSDHLKIHMKTHDNQKPFQCTVCNRGYNTAAALTSHMQNHKKPSEVESNSSAGTSYRCLECAKVFTKPDDLTAHIMNEHYLGPLSPQKKRKSPRPRLACIYCTKDSFHSMEALQLHVQAMHGSILNGSHSLIFSLGHSGSHSNETAQTGTLACHLCTMTFPSLQALQIHGSSAHGSKQNQEEFQCSLCGVSFPSYIWLVEHFNTSHHGAPSSAGLSTEQSKPTDLSFNRKEQRDRSPSAKKFKNSSHPTSTSPIVSANLKGTQYDYPGVLLCNQCDAALPDFESFRSHLKSHLEESVLLKIPQLRPSQLSVCPYCGVKVHSSQEMIQHMEVHFKSFTGDFECQICFQGFKLPEELQKHLIETHTQHLYRCSLCKDLFESKVAIQVHYAMKHCTEKKTLRCSVCLTLGPFQSESEFSHHVKTIHCSSISACSSPSVSPPRNLRCAFCHATFSTDSELQFHLAVHTKQFQCKYCNEAFHVEYLLEKHMQSNHVGAGAKTLKCDETRDKVDSYDSIVTNGFHSSPLHTSSKSMGNGAINSAYKPSRYTHEESTKNQDYATNNNVFKTTSNTNSNGNPFKGVCEVCALGNFSSEAELHSHRQMAHHIKSNNSSKMSLHCAYCKENCKSRSELENHMKAHCQSAVSSNKYKCNICDEMCLSVSALAEHKLTHCKVIFGSICTHCKIQIHDEESFLKHVMHHTNSTNGAGASGTNKTLVLPVACVICRQTLGSEMETRLHAKFHLQVELTQCSMCLQSCDKKDLKEKLCQHCQSDKATPAKCLECCVKFETHGALDLHMLMAHDKKGDFCKKCKKKFETEEEFKMHMENHFNSENRNAATKCNLCMLIFPTLSQLQIHLIEHTFLGCSNYTCYICSSVFTTPVGLQTHILDHGLSARPYDCSKCMKKFFFRAELDNHISLHIQNSTKTARSDNGLNLGESIHNETKDQETTKIMNESQKQSTSQGPSHYENKIRSENNEKPGVFKNDSVTKSNKVTVKIEPDSPEDEKLQDRTENTDSSTKTKDD